MRREEENVRPKDLSRRMGERGDLVACKSAEIGTAVKNGTVDEADVEELQEAIDELDELLERAVDVGAGGARRSRASAD